MNDKYGYVKLEDIEHDGVTVNLWDSFVYTDLQLTSIVGQQIDALRSDLRASLARGWTVRAAAILLASTARPHS